MNKFFSLNDIGHADPVQKDKNDVLQVEFTDLHDFKVANLNELVKGLPLPGSAFFIWTVNSFNAFTFIPLTLKIAGRIDELIISTYSINIRIINALSWYLNNNLIGNVYILISDSAKYRIPAVVDHLEQFSASYPERVTLRYAWNHSKITLIKTTDHHLVVEGSGNFSENSRHEQYMILNSQQIFEFRKKWITDEIHGRTN